MFARRMTSGGTHAARKTNRVRWLLRIYDGFGCEAKGTMHHKQRLRFQKHSYCRRIVFEDDAGVGADARVCCSPLSRERQQARMSGGHFVLPAFKTAKRL